MTCYNTLTNEELVTALQTGKTEPELVGTILHRFPEMVKIIEAQEKKIEDLEDEIEGLYEEND